MRYREHRGGLEESVRTTVEVDTKRDLLKLVNSIFWENFTEDQLKIRKYTENGDPRIGWVKLSIVSIEDFGVVGWLEGDL